MMVPQVKIRSETPQDVAYIRQVTEAAFKETEHSSGTEAAIVDDLRAAGALTVTLVAEADGQVVGHVAFSPITVEGDIRRFLLHVLPKGFHRIRHYGLLASGTRVESIEQARRLLDVPQYGAETPDAAHDHNAPGADLPPCPCCGSRRRIIETFARGETPSHRATPQPLVIRIDTS